MKVMIVTTPIRPVPSDYPPFGSLSLIKYLRRHGHDDVSFFHIDANRPDFVAAVDEIIRVAPDVVGISAVVSTAYAYTRQLADAVRTALPRTLIVVGGNLAASSHILLERTAIDLCVLGEGERVFLDVVNRAATTREPADFADIPGLMLKGREGKLLNTGYAAPLDRSEVYDIDWADLERACDIGHYVCKAFGEDGFHQVFREDPRAWEPHRRQKTQGVLVASKGCVARCTFCHRWDKGIRYVPVPILVKRVRDMVERYDLGFLQFGDENFGTDHKWLAEFCAAIKPLDLLWSVKGMRVNRIDPASIILMKDAGCTSIVYGMETGSARMLEIMEKKTSIEANRNAMKWTVGANLYTVIQLVLGMPGESPETIAESIEFCKYGMTLSPDINPNDLSVNYAQALPGTPLYDYGRHHGLIRTGLDAEEQYLLQISDRNAHDESATLNFTEYPKLECETWRPLITIETNYAYVRKYGLSHYHKVLLGDANHFRRKRTEDGYYANPKRLVDRSLTTDSLHGVKTAYETDQTETVPPLWPLLRKGNFGLAMICYPVLFYRLRRLLILMVLLKNLRSRPLGQVGGLVREYLGHKLAAAGRRTRFAYKSLRRIVDDDLGDVATDPEAVRPLRKGR